MSTPANLWELVLFAGALQALVLSLFLFTHRKGNQPANMVLGLLMVALAFELLTALVPARGGLPLGFVAFLYAPLLYLYAHLLLQKDPGKYRPFVTAAIPVYAVPLLLYGLACLGRLARSDPGGAQLLTDTTLATVAAPSPPAALLLSVTSAVFLVFSSRALRRAARFAAGAFSSAAVLQVRWLRTVHTVAMALFIALVAGTSLTAFGILKAGPVAVALRVSLAALVFTIGFYGLRHPALFSGTETEALDPGGDDSTRQASSGDARLAAVKEELLSTMEAERPYLDPSLTIRSLSAQLGVGHRSVSRALNEHIGKTFFEFVNGYRAEHARAMLADAANDNRTVITIAYESGFNSKSVFNVAFKEALGTTPSEYRRSCRG